MSKIDDIVRQGPFFAGDTGPDLDFILLWDGGGYVDLTNASPTLYIHRWDTRRSSPIGSLVTSGSCSVINPTLGECKYVWTAGSPIPTIPLDSGWYMGQLKVVFTDNETQHTQIVVFEVKQGL